MNREALPPETIAELERLHDDAVQTGTLVAASKARYAAAKALPALLSAAKRVAELEAERDRLREAVAWYADTDNWKRVAEAPSMPCAAVYDSGKRARAALQSSEETP
jgi:glutamate-1-semialdehyde aminotransferase